ENWRRPVSEVSELMGLLKAFAKSDLARLNREGVRIKVLGRREGLAPDILAIIEETERLTAANTHFDLQVAFNYGGRADILDAARRYAADVRDGRADADIDEDGFGRYLSTAEGGAPDLIVRTSGERRISNFLLWEAAYAELVFQDVLWPDYGAEHLRAALDEFHARDRRYGGVETHGALAAG
ncbi:MAG: polyprenyl diphosphate synthase, partial [Caulobacteraceae bacterium]